MYTEEAFILELFHRGKIYELPANIRFNRGGYVFYVSLPGVDVVFKGQKDGPYHLCFLNNVQEDTIDKIDQKLISAICNNINAIVG